MKQEINWKEIKKRIKCVLKDMNRRTNKKRTAVGYEDDLIKITIKIKSIEK